MKSFCLIKPVREGDDLDYFDFDAELLNVTPTHYVIEGPHGEARLPKTVWRIV